MIKLVSGVLVLAAFVGGVAAWGNLGHQTVGYVAQQFLAPKAAAFVNSSLGSTYSYSLGVAATWADTVKYETGYTWSAPLHFVDANDSPLTGSCSVQETRDCGDNDCILAAIANYTTRVVNTGLSATQRQEALKFLDHFHGDISQPLHVEAYEVGGNDINAICGGSSTNLHAAWDTGIVTTNVNANHGGAATTYANDLVARIKTGIYESQTSSWLACDNTTEPVYNKRSVEDDVNGLLVSKATTITPLECPLVWAREANAFDCTVVFNYTTGQDLCAGSYYNAAVPVIDLQLARSGYRLAAWLNVLFDGSPNLP
ncbi:hypothetical protein JAAARDRAFT_73787 [Jaapia argillacea MUCL 33604]|uniref:Nuclease Le1 n=1 Tax=Jaapia argillacea MUCL 33604 TaxID=933084 RepID=A0A067PKY8_9AGAM|nr:hypothetical protein JAAARDRAFT_73787 [Jaapia argillacea MUCL 33604]